MNSHINSKRIAKNTGMLYVRMMFSMFVSLYTARVVLANLGVEDFGIYNVVGSVVGMLSFLNASMSGATSRFLTYEMGKRDQAAVKKVFSSAVTVHVLIALLILVLSETVGIWLLESKLVIPDARMTAARFVYQCSIVSTILAIINVPYGASVIAHERMGFFALADILQVCLRLAVVLYLAVATTDKLMTYGFLSLCISVVGWLLVKVYSTKNFAECRFRLRWDKETILPMLSFSGWDLYGNLSVMARTQGVSMLLNVFFGPLLNAASGVAVRVQSAVMGLAANVMLAVRPQIVKSYAAGEYQQMVGLVMNASKFTFLLLLFFSVPLIVEMSFVLNLWLKNVPDYAVIFCQLTLIFNFLGNMSSVILGAIHATGKIKRPSLINGTLYLLVIPVSYFSYKAGADPQVAYICNVCFVMVGMLSNAWTLKLYVPEFSFGGFIFRVVGVCLGITLLSASATFWMKSLFDEGWLRFICVGVVSSISIAVLTYGVAMDRSTRAYITKWLLLRVRGV